MNLLTTWRGRAGKIALLALLNRQKSAHITTAYPDVKRIGLLVPLHGHDDLQWIDDLCNRLSKDGKACTLLGFSALPIDTPVLANITILGPEDLKWNFIPKEDAIKSFISTNFDLLLNLCTDSSCLPLDYTAIRAHAALRIGRYEPTLTNAYGLMVKGDFADSKELLTAIKHYLKKIQ